MPILTIVSNNLVENCERRETHSHFYCLSLSLWLNPSPSAVNPIFSVHKKTNPNSHFTLSQSYLVDWCKWGFFAVFKTNVSIFRVISFNALWKFLWLRNSTWDFFGVNFCFRYFFGFCWKPWGFFWVLIFASIRSSLSLEIRSTLPWLMRRMGENPLLIPRKKHSLGRQTCEIWTCYCTKLYERLIKAVFISP